MIRQLRIVNDTRSNDSIISMYNIQGCKLISVSRCRTIVCTLIGIQSVFSFGPNTVIPRVRKQQTICFASRPSLLKVSSYSKRAQRTVVGGSAVDAIEPLRQRKVSGSKKATNNSPGIPTAVTKKPRMDQIEMVTMSTAGAALIVVLLYTLAGNGDTRLETLTSASVESFEVASYNIMDAALPLTISETLSVAIGEAIAGIIGAIVTFALSTRLQWKNSRMFRGETATEAVADGDFLLTQAATVPLLAGIGLSPLFVQAVSIGIAMLPFSLVKLRSRQRQQTLEEEKLMQQYLSEQLEKEEAENRWKISPNIISFISPPSYKTIVDVDSLVPVQDDKKSKVKLDPVEVFSDVLKWLQFNVLSSELGGNLIVPSQIYLLPGGQSAFFGTIATLSSQFYSDLLYGYFGLGGDDKRDMVRSRNSMEWFTLYLYKTVYAAVLFGVYAIVQIPVRIGVNALLSGGVDGCVGSEDVKACIDGYIALNPPGASAEAQLRSLVTTLYSVWYNLGLPDF